MQLRLAPLWWSIGALLVAIDVVLSLVSTGEGSALMPDKLVHFTTYFLLTFWFASLAVRRRFIAVVGVILLGGVLEIAQGLTRARHTDWMDFLANSAGAMLAVVIVLLLPTNLFAWIERRIS